jgi:hypothetical protein
VPVWKNPSQTEQVVLTGGPGGGKTAVLEMARRYFCHHVTITPEAASIVLGGGFPRSDTPAERREAQKAIFHVQRGLETVALGNHQTAVILIRNEGVRQARETDARIARAWHGHPRILPVGAQAGFLDKLAYAIELLRGELPVCGQTHLHALRTEPG